jgi:predicted homoserine dehydrogenase-like protein
VNPTPACAVGVIGAGSMGIDRVIQAMLLEGSEKYRRMTKFLKKSPHTERTNPS